MSGWLEIILCKLTSQIMIFDVTEVIPEPGKPLTKHKLKVTCDVMMTESNTCTCISSVSL